MSYTAFDGAKPDASSQNGTQFAQSARDNFNAVVDMIVSGTGFPGWNMAQSGGTADQPAALIWSSGTNRVKAELTWGTSGGEDGNVTVAVYKKSTNSGSSYDTIKTCTMTYDSNGYCTATTWS